MSFQRHRHRLSSSDPKADVERFRSHHPFYDTFCNNNYASDRLSQPNQHFPEHSTHHPVTGTTSMSGVRRPRTSDLRPKDNRRWKYRSSRCVTTAPRHILLSYSTKRPHASTREISEKIKHYSSFQRWFEPASLLRVNRLASSRNRFNYNMNYKCLL